MTRRLIADTANGLRRAAMVDGRRLVDLAVDIVNAPVLLGSIWRTRIDRLVPGVGAFCMLGEGRSGLLRGADASGRTSGDTLLVQVVSRRGGGKADIVSSEIRLAGSLFIHLPASGEAIASRRARAAGLPQDLLELLRQEGIGGIVRLEAAGAGSDAVMTEARRLSEAWQAIADLAPSSGMIAPGPEAAVRLGTDYPDVPAAEGDFERWGVAEAFAALRQPMVKLPGGGGLLIERTAALTAIDVNTGSAPATRRVNAEAVEEIGRQIRLRNLSGLIMIDWAPPANHQAVCSALQKVLADDPAGCRIAGATPSGLTEMTRTRRDPPLDEVLELSAATPT